jgi:aspartyl-tRNA(Asn)/glutamyl-tRNA(Gln) amidotransferase subunit A
VSLGSWIQGLFLGGEDYLEGQRAKGVLLKQVINDLFARCDVVVQTDPVPFDMIGLPELAFNIGFSSSSGLPLSMYSEDRQLSLDAAFQAVTDFDLQRPADPVVTAAFGRAVELQLAMEDVIEQTE